MKEADRTARIGMYSMLVMGGIIIITVIAEIFSDISHAIPIILAIYTIANALFWTAVINTNQKKSIVLVRYLIGFVLSELGFIIPFLIIFLLKSII